MAAALADAVAESGADARPWALAEAGPHPGVDAMETLAAAPGRTDLLATCTPVFVQAPLLGKTPVTHRGLTPLRRLVGDRYLVVGPPDRPTDADAWLRGLRAGGTRTGGYFAGGINHLLGLAIAASAGARMEFVVVGSEADLFPALLDGRIDWAVATPVELGARDPESRLRRIAAVAPEPLAASPNLPTLASLGLGVDFQLWRGLCGPPGLAADALALWQRVIEAATGTDTWRDYLLRNAQTPAPLAADAFRDFLDSEWDWYAAQMSAAGVLEERSA
jgi:putative tricarboxylic transport membrane protein